MNNRNDPGMQTLSSDDLQTCGGAMGPIIFFGYVSANATPEVLRCTGEQAFSFSVLK